MPRSSRTPRRQSREPQHKRLKELEFLISSSRLLNSTLDFAELLDLIMKIVKEALDVQTVSILFLDKEKKNMVFELARGKRDKEILGLKIPVGEGVAGWVAKHHKPCIINDLKRQKRFTLKLDKQLFLDTRSIISIPLKRGSEFIGVLEAVNRRGKRPFTEDDLGIFMALGDHIATAIANARLYREAERSRLESKLLLKTSASLGKRLTLDGTLEEILSSLQRLIPYDAAAVFVLDRKNQLLVSHIERGYAPSAADKLKLKLDEGVVGWAATNKASVIVPDCAADPRYVNARPKTRSEMVAPILSRGRVIGLFNLESNRKDAYREDDVRLLEAFAAHAGVALERARLYEERRVKLEIERELRVAQTVQRFFTRRKSYKIGDFRVAGRNYPSLELSGDYYDFFPLAKPFHAFAIADVAGKGVPASIIMSSFRATLRASAPYFTRAWDLTRRANQILMDTVRPEDFVTAFIGVLNPETGELTYCNAGHNPVVVVAPDGSHDLLHSTGPVLGVFDAVNIEEGRFLLEDRMLLCYTDGTTDARNGRDEEFGLERLISFATEHRDLSPSGMCTALRALLKEHIQDTPLLDDMTFLVLKKGK